MDKWKVTPLKAVGKIQFGMPRDAVRKIMGNIYKEYRKNKYSKNTLDDFGFYHVFYDMNDMCEAVEIFENVEIEIDDIQIFPGTVSNAYRIIGDLAEGEGGLISISQSVGISVSDGRIESILFGKKDYYL